MEFRRVVQLQFDSRSEPKPAAFGDPLQRAKRLSSRSATLDAEDWRDLVGAYLDDAAKAIGQYGGHVAKNLGDGALVSAAQRWERVHWRFIAPMPEHGGGPQGVIDLFALVLTLLEP